MTSRYRIILVNEVERVFLEDAATVTSFALLMSLENVVSKLRGSQLIMAEGK